MRRIGYVFKLSNARLATMSGFSKFRCMALGRVAVVRDSVPCDAICPDASRPHLGAL